MTVDDIVKIMGVVSPIALALLAYLTLLQNRKLDRVEKQTDGLAHQLAAATGVVEHARGVSETKDEATVLATAEARQVALIEAIVTRITAQQTAALVKPNGEPLRPPAPPDPGPVAAAVIKDIKEVVDDVQPRVVAIESATTDRDKAVEMVATSADERLTKLEEKAP